MAIEHDSIADGEIHEPKGASTAPIGTAYISDGAGSGSWAQPVGPKMGWWNYADLATTTTPIPLTLANTDYILTNDGAGAQTITVNALPGVDPLWVVGTNRFDFTGLSIGDTVDIRVDIDINTVGANDTISVGLELAEGAVTYTIDIVGSASYKTAGEHSIVTYTGVYIGDSNTKDNPGFLKAQCDNTGATVHVHGWYIRAITRS